MNEGDIKPKSDIAKKEEEILKFWNENKIFEKTLVKESPKGDFVFYDGPPFATGLPHFGHILPTTMKDVIPRYKTMQGFRVPRRWGWDCHGLPIENLIEKELGLKNKKDIEEYGIENFNEKARASVLRYADIWKEIIPRLGRWVDMEDDYRTMDSTYTESVWWSFKNLTEKNRVYESFKVMPFCPRCGTTLSNFEVNQGYKDITDISAYVKFELIDETGTFVLAWTTTPWTLPGNVALAVNPEVDYIKAKKDGAFYILAKNLAQKVLKENFEITETFKGESLIGKSYKPVFNYYQDSELKNAEGKVIPKENAREKGWKIFGADFVTTEDGTGVVHIAPAFGEDDLVLGRKENLPFIQHVDQEGKFKKEVTDFASKLVKPKDDPSTGSGQAHQEADIEIIKYLAHNNFLFAKEKFIHSYPHCWRCDTPLLNYATSSWFVRVTQFKDKLVEENKKVDWVPESIGDNRFGKWLEGARDWAISRSRYWGAPMPVWKCSECEKVETIGSIEELKKKTKRNTYHVMRHGEAEHNVKNIVNGVLGEPYYHLTEKGREDVLFEAKKLKNIDVIVHSPLTRTKETARIVAEANGIDEVIEDPRIIEENFGELEGKSFDEYLAFYAKEESRVESHPNGGESLLDVRKRAAEFLYDIDSRYEGKNILIITHDGPAKILTAAAEAPDNANLFRIWKSLGRYLQPGESKEFHFSILPHDKDYMLDLHRPYIDEIKWKCDCGGEFHRIPEVFDTWYDSGSMPFAKNHYMGEGNPKEFPADFIAEGIDQTRGWFYSLLVLNDELFNQSPYRNVIVNGTVLAEDGQKMSKRLNNYPDLMETVNKYGADPLRYFLMCSPAVKAEDIAFSIKGIDEVTKKVINRLNNVLTFYETYMSREADSAESSTGFSAEWDKEGSKNVLDQWMIARFNQIAGIVTYSLDKYELDKAARPIADFVDDLSTWYLRRSRDRFKSDNEDDKEAALSTTKYILEGFSKIIAPFMPFLAEDVYRRAGGNLESVHLESWPNPPEVKPREIPNLESRGLTSGEPAILLEMTEVRKIVSLGLEARAKAGIKVRQPLSELKIRTDEMDISENADYLELIKDEVNVKEVILDAAIENDVILNTNITEGLKEEGNVRELMRAIQDLRKEEGLQVADRVTLSIETDNQGLTLVEKFQDEIKKVAGLTEIKFEENDPSNTSGQAGAEMKIGTLTFKLKIVK